MAHAWDRRKAGATGPSLLRLFSTSVYIVLAVRLTKKLGVKFRDLFVPNLMDICAGTSEANPTRWVMQLTLSLTISAMREVENVGLFFGVWFWNRKVFSAEIGNLTRRYVFGPACFTATGCLTATMPPKAANAHGVAHPLPLMGGWFLRTFLVKDSS